MTIPVTYTFFQEMNTQMIVEFSIPVLLQYCCSYKSDRMVVSSMTDKQTSNPFTPFPSESDITVSEDLSPRKSFNLLSSKCHYIYKIHRQSNASSIDFYIFWYHIFLKCAFPHVFECGINTSLIYKFQVQENKSFLLKLIDEFGRHDLLKLHAVDWCTHPGICPQQHEGLIFLGDLKLLVGTSANVLPTGITHPLARI